MHTTDTLLQFWFGTLSDGFASTDVRRRWFASDQDFDRRVARDFSDLLAAAQRGELAHWRESPRNCLALIVLTDQFPRQIHRSDAHAFATDAIALASARHGIDKGFDRALTFDERAFFYMPFEHSESLTDQHRSVELFRALVDATPAAGRKYTADMLRFAEKHRDIIVEFGRFPHRNALLRRASSEAELTFLATASRFGQ